MAEADALDGMANAAAEEEERANAGLSLGMPGDGYDDGAAEKKGRRRCMCLGNCIGSKHRHEAGQCNKFSVADRPLCSSCKAAKGSSQDRPRNTVEAPAGVGDVAEVQEGALVPL